MALAFCFTNARLNVKRDLGVRNLHSIVDNASGHFLWLFQFNFQNNFVFDSRILASTVRARHVKSFLNPFAVKNDGDSVSVFGPGTPPFSDLTGCLKKVKRSTLVGNLLL